MELENSSKLIKELRVQHGISMTNSGIEVKFWANLVSNSCPSVHQRVVERWLKTKPSPDRYGAGVPVFVTFFFAATCLGPCLNWRNVSSWSHRLSITSVTIVSFPVSSWPYFFLFSLPLLRYLHRVCVCATVCWLAVDGSSWKMASAAIYQTEATFIELKFAIFT